MGNSSILNEQCSVSGPLHFDVVWIGQRVFGIKAKYEIKDRGPILINKHISMP